MREFTNLTVHPGWQIIIDGESYLCPGFTPPADLQGAVRVVPADRILAIQWFGTHNHGSIEGFGAVEGFTDKEQLAPYVSAWLKARVDGKTEKLATLTRTQQQVGEALASMADAEAALKGDIDNLDPQRDANQIEGLKMILERHQEEMGKTRERMPSDAAVKTAADELATAQAELDADNAQA